MGIREDFAPYWDSLGLLAPGPINLQGSVTLVPGSDNGPMFTSEYHLMLKNRGELTAKDRDDFYATIRGCMYWNYTDYRGVYYRGLLTRSKIGYNNAQEGPDDYMAVLNACKALSITDIPKAILGAAWRFKGALNNVSPGTWTKESFLVRQPQLVAAMVSAAYPSLVNPLHYLIRTLYVPFYICAAVTIAISCIGAPTSDTDARRLSWHLLQNVRETSILCKLASLLWFKRLFGHYGALGMKAVAKIYYQPQGDNPYSRWWVNGD